jgi:hypothetical protein
LLIVVATFLFSSHDAIQIPLGFLPDCHGGVGALCGAHLADGRDFLPQSGLRVLRTKRPLLHWPGVMPAGHQSVFHHGADVSRWRKPPVNFLAPVLVTALSVPLLKER